MLSLYNKMTQKVVVAAGGEEDFPAIEAGDEVQNPEAIFIQAKTANTADVYIGKSGVLTDDSTGAFVFSAGDNGILPFVRDEQLKLNTTAGQVIYITYLAEVSAHG